MFRRLGLGIELSLKDNFTNPAQKLSGMFQNLKNSAKEMVDSVDNEMIRLNTLLNSTFALDRLGRNVANFGKGIVNVFRRIGDQVVKVGSQMENFRIAYTSLYGSEEVAEQKIQWALELGRRTPFESSDVLQAMIGLKASGIDVDKVYTAPDGTTKSLLEFIGDLGALRPDQGLKGAIWAFRNLVGGSQRSLVTRFDINPDQILGRKMDLSSTETIIRDFIELVTKIAPNMMTNMEGSFTVLRSNMEDFLVLFTKGIAESGIFDKVKSTLEYLQETFEKANLEKKGKALSNILISLYKPVDLLVRKIADLIMAVTEFADKYPKIAKFFGVLAGGVGIATFVGGKFLSMSANILTSITMLRLWRREAQLSGTVMGKTGLAFRKLASFMGIALTGLTLFAIAYKDNMFGIRDVTKDVVEKIEKKFERFGLMLGTVIKVFTNDEGGRVFFEEDFVKRLQESGLWEWAQDLVGLKGQLNEFFKGFSEGVKEVLEQLKKLFTFLGFIDEDSSGGSSKSKGIVARLKDWLGDDKDLNGIGKKVGKFITTILLIKSALKLVGSVFSLAKGIFAFGGKIFGKVFGKDSLFGKLFGSEGGFFREGGTGYNIGKALFGKEGLLRKGAKVLFGKEGLLRKGAGWLGGLLVGKSVTQLPFPKELAKGLGGGGVLATLKKFIATQGGKLLGRVTTQGGKLLGEVKDFGKFFGSNTGKGLITGTGIAMGGYDIYKGVKEGDDSRKRRGIGQIGSIGIGGLLGTGIGAIFGGPGGAVAGAKIGASAGSLVGSLFGEKIGGGIQTGWSKLKEWTQIADNELREFSARISEWSYNTGEEFSSWVEEKKNNISQKFTTLKQNVSNHMQTFKQNVLTSIEIFKNNVIQNVSGMWDTLKGKGAEIKGNVLGFFSTIHENVKGKVDGMLSKVKEFVQYVAEIPSKIKGGLNWVSEKVSGVFGGKKRTADSSNWGGLDYVPRDNYLINAHRGEMLLSKREADILRNASKNPTPVSSQPSNVDNSVTIENVNISIIAQNSTEEEAKKLTAMILEELERQLVKARVRNNYEYVRS